MSFSGPSSIQLLLCVSFVCVVFNCCTVVSSFVRGYIRPKHATSLCNSVECMRVLMSVCHLYPHHLCESPLGTFCVVLRTYVVQYVYLEIKSIHAKIPISEWTHIYVYTECLSICLLATQCKRSCIFLWHNTVHILHVTSLYKLVSV